MLKPIYAPSPTGLSTAVHGILGGTDRQVLGAWAIWAFLTLAAFGFVAVYGLPFPFGRDEWLWMGQATGNEPVTLAWLWSQHNEHRMFLPRLIYLGLGKLTGFDFRAGCFFNVFMLSGLSLAMMQAARAVRGRTRLCDAFFPLLLLNWGQFDNLIWGFQLNFVTSAVLEGAILMIVLRCGCQITLRSAVLLTVCLVLLGLCGSYGLVFLPPMACWLLYASACKWKSGLPGGKKEALTIFACAAMVAALVGFYLYGLGASPGYMGLYASLSTGVEFLSFGIGPAAKEIWPLSGFLIILISAIVIRQCLTVFSTQPAQRLRAMGFLLFFAGIILLAAAIGYGRAHIGSMGGYETRYITLSALVLPLVFFLYEAHGSPAQKFHVPRILFALMSGLLIVNTQKGISYTENIWKNLVKFERDMRNGIPAESMGVRYADQWPSGMGEMISTRLVWLQRARIGLYRSSASPGARMVRVERMCRQESARGKIEPIRLAAGQSFAQAFSVQEDGEICRIDVQIQIGRDARGLKRLDWAVFEIAADGMRNLIDKNCIDPARDDGDGYVTIPLKNVNARKGQRFLLELSIPCDAASGVCLEIPLYEGADEREIRLVNYEVSSEPTSEPDDIVGMMRGFVYLKTPGQ